MHFFLNFCLYDAEITSLKSVVTLLKQLKEDSEAPRKVYKIKSCTVQRTENVQRTETNMSDEFHMATSNLMKEQYIHWVTCF